MIPDSKKGMTSSRIFAVCEAFKPFIEQKTSECADDEERAFVLDHCLAVLEEELDAVEARIEQARIARNVMKKKKGK